MIVQGYQVIDRWLRWVLYNLAVLQHAHVRPLTFPWPVSSATWGHYPYGYILALYRQGDIGWLATGYLHWFHLGAAVISAFVLVLLWWLGRLAYRRRPRTWHEEIPAGGARWASDDELRAYQQEETPFALGRVCGENGEPSGHLLYLPWTLLATSVLYIAPPGAGKSTHIISELLRLQRVTATSPCLFLWDVKEELLARTGGALARAGYRLVVLNPYVLYQRINPLIWCVNARWCDLFWEAWLENSAGGVGSVTAERAHNDWSRQILTAVTLLLRAERGDGPPVVLPDVFAFLRQEPAVILERLKEAPDGGNGAVQWQTMLSKGVSTFGNQLNALVMRGNLFRDPEPCAFVSGHDLDLDALLGGVGAPLALYLQIPSAMQQQVMPLTAAITALIFAQVQERAARCGGQLPRRLFCLFDEAGSGAKIPALGNYLNLLRGAGVALVVVLQYLRQVVEKYGEDEAFAIKEGCGTWIVTGGLSPADAAEVAERAGKERVFVVTMEQKRGETMAVERSRRESTRYLIEPDVLRRLDDWVRLVLPRSAWPFSTAIEPYFSQGALRKRIAPAPAPVHVPPASAPPVGSVAETEDTAAETSVFRPDTVALGTPRRKITYR